MSLDMHNIEAIYARLPDAAKSYAVNWDKDSQETMENTKVDDYRSFFNIFNC